jgi:monoamine oxidase
LGQDKYAVLIVGAGAAGLAAGRMLAEAGKRVCIVEARPRIGGRILTVRQPAPNGTQIPVELGAEFIHGLPASSWGVAREAKLDTYELDGSQWFFDGHTLRRSGEEQGSFEVLSQMSQWLAHQPEGADATFAQYLKIANLDALHAKQAANYVEGFNAADRQLVSVAALARQQRAEDAIQGDRIFHIRQGYSALPQFLADRFGAAGGEILLSSPVDSIRWAAGEVAMSGVRTGGEYTLHADQAIITLPLGVLRARTVKFDPAPSDIEIQARRMEMGAALRISLLFAEAFWRDDSPASVRDPLRNLSFLFARGERLPTWWTSTPDPVPLITAWVAGPKSLALALEIARSGDLEALADAAVEQLSRMFDTPLAHLRQKLVSWHTHDWQADPYSRGAYSYVPSGALDASGLMTAPVANTLYFAGEHTDVEGHWGTVHAALNSGLRAAAQLLGLEWQTGAGISGHTRTEHQG